MTLVAIHQPTFLPWLGWWDKLVRADVLVLLDDVQFPKKGGTWMNRVRLLINGEPAWVTIPVDRAYHGVRLIRDMRIDDAKPWRSEVLKTIAASYKAAPHFADVYPQVEEAFQCQTDSIAEFNEATLRRFAERLGLNHEKLVRQSELGVDGAQTNLLVDICDALRATAYLTGDGAGGYLDPEQFSAAGLQLVRQSFTPHPYPQLPDTHVPGLSIVDALMNCGWSGTRALLER
ncbi:MAG: WbqC family protein [Solirubrobacteraceae bacterium]